MLAKKLNQSACTGSAIQDEESEGRRFKCLVLLLNPELWGHGPVSHQNFEEMLLVGTMSSSRQIWESSDKKTCTPTAGVAYMSESGWVQMRVTEVSQAVSHPEWALLWRAVCRCSTK